MKALVNILSVCFVLSGISCKSANHTVEVSDTNVSAGKYKIGNPKAINTLSSIDVVYYQTKGEPYAKIYAPKSVIPYVMLEKSSDELKVYYRPGVKINGDEEIRVDVYAPSVTKFSTLSSGDISIPKGLKTDKDVEFYILSSGDINCSSLKCNDLNTKVNSSGDVNFEWAECNHASFCINSSGDITVAGKCTDAVIVNNSSGDMNAEAFKASKVDATVNSSGDVSCMALSDLRARGNSSGNLTYKGNPSSVNVSGNNIHKK